MKKNGLATVSTDTPKRVILYPHQEPTNQSTVNGLNVNKTRTNLNESNSNGTTNQRVFRPALQTTTTNGLSKTVEKPKVDDGTPMAPAQPSTAMTSFQLQNPYYSNPFFRPRIVQNSSQTMINGNGSTTAIHRDSSSTTMNAAAALQQNPSALIRTLSSSKTQNSLILTPQRAPNSDMTIITAVNQDDSRNWAHAVARRFPNDQIQKPTINLSTSNINNGTVSEVSKQKVSSTTDIVLSLMDPFRLQTSNGNSNSTNVLTRPILTREEPNPSTNSGPQPETNVSQSTTNSSLPTNHHQDWRKNLTVRYQQNTKNIATAKIFQSKQITTMPTVLNGETIVPQPMKTERILGINSNQNERTFQASDTTPAISLLIRKSTDIVRPAKQENNNVERSVSLQIPPSPLSNAPVSETTPSSRSNQTNENPPENKVNIKETNNSETMAHVPLTVPSSLISAKPAVTVDQQKAIITRVMIRRDFVKSNEPRKIILTNGDTGSSIGPQSNNAGVLPKTAPAQSSVPNDSNSNRIFQNVQQQQQQTYQYQQQQQQQQQHQQHLSQKSILPFTSMNSTQRENRNQNNIVPRITNPVTNRIDSPTTRILSPTATHRANSLSAGPPETKKKKEELNNVKVKRRAISGSSMSRNTSLEKDPFEVEDEEFEAELEEESARSSESEVENDNASLLDPAALLSDKVRRVGNVEVRPGFFPSLFAHVPPTIRFCTENQRIEQLPLPLRKMMKWKMSSITPNIVKNTVIRSGFRLITGDEGNDWLGTWSRHMKPICFKAIREYQKVNHFPGSFQIGRKDRLWRNLSHMQAVHSRREFDFVPQTYVLPADLLLFKRVFEETTDTKECKWIIKPPASARGQGIRVVNKLEHIPKKRPVIVQKYISNPYLINGHKFDLRLYVYVTSHDPLRIYLFDDGLTRFASRKYSASIKSLNDRFMHLTNYSINRYNSEYRTNNDTGACTGHKWSLKALWTYLKKRDVDVPDIMEKIKDLIIKTIISADAYVNVLTKANVRRKFSVHELFGFDVILDESLKPYIVEVNISPSLHSNSPLDISVKGAMICDLLNLSGFMIPDRRDLLTDGSARRKPKLPKSLIFDRRILPQALSTDEKIKHQYFSQRYHDEQARRNILDVLTPDDLRILIETEDEFNRRGAFERIFPTAQTRKYLKYFETPRYYNLLLNEWILKYQRMEERGVALLNGYCKKNIHIQHPASDPNHMWTQYQKLQGHVSYRDNENNNNGY